MSAGRGIAILIVVAVLVMVVIQLHSRVLVMVALSAYSMLCFELILFRLASSFPCLVELGIGQNILLTDSSLASVARSYS